MLFSGDHQGTDLQKVEHSSPKTPSVFSAASTLSNRASPSWADVTDDNSFDDQIWNSSSSLATSEFLPHVSFSTAFESLSDPEEAKQPLSPLIAGALPPYESEQSAKIHSSTIDGTYGGSEGSKRQDVATQAQLSPCRIQAQATDESAWAETACTSAASGIAAGSLSLTLVVSLDVVGGLSTVVVSQQDASSDTRGAKRVFALQELGILGMKDGQAGIARVVNCLEEKDDRVCQAAIEALRQFATKGDQRIVAALIAKLQHTRSNVKKVALELLGDLTEVGDHNVVTQVCACLEHDVTSASVTTAAVATLCTLALQGDQEYIVASLTKLVSHKSKNVRKVAIQSLVKLSERGIAISVSAVSSCTADSQSDVRIATLKAITKFADTGDQEALFAASDCLGDPEHEVRIASLKAIAQIAVKGDQDAMMAVSLSVADADSGVRLAALCAIAEIADKGDENAFAYSRLLGRPRRKSGGASGQGAASSGGEESTLGACSSWSYTSHPGTSHSSAKAEHSCSMQ